jgi:putative spermidine/putrescine transport system ATP-binding protein
MAEVRLESVFKYFGKVAAINGLSLKVADGELIALLGPSGCGKTTTLRCVGGFVDPSGGDIFFGSHRVTHLLPEQRHIGMVFQNYALFPHMTVLDNVAFGLRTRHVPAADVRRRVAAILKKVQLQGLEQRYARQLSGGQQQRVALARALVIEPEVLLLDEPLANLDAKLREEMRFYIRSLQKEVGITTIYVTHDQAEAMVIADRIAVMFSGVLQQFGTPREIYEKPHTRQVADFIGLTNLMPGRVIDLRNGRGVTETAIGRLTYNARSNEPARGDIVVSVRPENITLSPRGQRPDGDYNTIDGKIVLQSYLGNLYDYRVAVAGDLVIRVQCHPDHTFRLGDPVTLSFATESTWAIPI